MRKYSFDLGNGKTILVSATNYDDAIEAAKKLIKELQSTSASSWR